MQRSIYVLYMYVHEQEAKIYARKYFGVVLLEYVNTYVHTHTSVETHVCMYVRRTCACMCVCGYAYRKTRRRSIHQFTQSCM